VDSKKVIKALRKAGWELVDTRGSHHKFRDPKTGKITVIPHPRKDLPIGTLRSIEKQTGLKF
jgi:predicted RNA binding protein YcfA (HicA-like mRNA interferase family)